MMDRRFRGAILPLAFIVAGILLLLNTLDLVDWAIWPKLARLWPVLLIGFGASLLWQHGRKS
ncbi:hypothetical protein IH601_12465 [Candidatus Bipolaricaulota bacterium]|nr:hypothetical protein [Candidatus Bipolaricaulota bacterium]TFH09884.1 MAG: hypothetical protein E4H08_04800 [Candidatus Atribacteria bacterium]